MGGQALNPVFQTLGTTIFTVMSALATKHGAINLGQGFPDEDGPMAIREAAARALRDGPNQYPPMQGLLALRQAVAVHSRQVYDLLVFDGRPHVPLISLPAMRERCVRVGSAGKMFALTGWKIGWLTGPARLVQVVSKAHQFNTFTTSPALQLGVTHGLTSEMD